MESKKKSQEHEKLEDHKDDSNLNVTVTSNGTVELINEEAGKFSVGSSNNFTLEIPKYTFANTGGYATHFTDLEKIEDQVVEQLKDFILLGLVEEFNDDKALVIKDKIEVVLDKECFDYFVKIHNLKSTE